MIRPKLQIFFPKSRFVPLSYQPEKNDIPVHTLPTGFDALRTLAVSRIYLASSIKFTACCMGWGRKLVPGYVLVGDQGLARGCFPLVPQLQAA